MPRRRSFKLPLRVIYLGTIGAVKGAGRLIELARIIRDRNLSIQIDAYGRSEKRGMLQYFSKESADDMRERIDRENLSRYLRINGYTTQPEMKLLEADILARPSIFNDPWGRDVLEAMAVGTPVVAVGRYDRFIQSGKTGLLLETWSATACVDFLTDMCRNPEALNDMSKHGRALARELFNPKNYARSIEAIYDQIFHSVRGTVRKQSGAVRA